MNSSENDSAFLTVAEVADVLKLNQQTVRNWIDQGALPALRIGRRVRIRRADFDRLMRDGLKLPGQDSPDVPTAADFWGGEVVDVVDIAPPPRTDETVSEK